MTLFVHFSLAIFTVLFVFTGCAIDRSIKRCSDGDQEVCTCEDGSNGFKLCIAGAFKECECEADAVSVDESSRDNNSGSEGGRITQSTDNGKDATFKIDSSGVDSGFEATIPLNTEERPDAEQRDVASSETSVDANIADTGSDSVRDSGEPESGRDTGTEAGVRTTVYGQCKQGECSGDQQCTEPLEGADPFCSIPCLTAQDCPVPTSGTAVRRCGLFDGMCRINCTSGDCPDDMVCFGSGVSATCAFSQQTAVYGQCGSDGCSADQQCTVVYNGTGTYCSIPCEETEQCPVPTSGTAERRCSTVDGTCRLDCQSGDCPEGMECFETIMRSTCVWN